MHIFDEFMHKIKVFSFWTLGMAIVQQLQKAVLPTGYIYGIPIDKYPLCRYNELTQKPLDSHERMY